MRKIILIAIIFLTGCSQQQQEEVIIVPHYVIGAIDTESTLADKTYNFEVVIKIDSSIAATTEANAKIELKNILKESLNWDLSDNEVSLISIK